jgi:hypothetical protein
MLYALKYEKANKGELNKVLKEFERRGGRVQLVRDLLDYAGEERRGSKLFGDGSAMARVLGVVRRGMVV